MLSIETKNLTKKFKEKTVVNGIELRINEGELFALLGTNGAGKTTTIKMLSTLILPTDGEIKINGLDIIKDRQKNKRNHKCISSRNSHCSKSFCKRKSRIYGRSISNT